MKFNSTPFPTHNLWDIDEQNLHEFIDLRRGICLDVLTSLGMSREQAGHVLDEPEDEVERLRVLGASWFLDGLWRLHRRATQTAASL